MRFPINYFMAECEKAFFFAVKHYNFSYETGHISNMRAGIFQRAYCFDILLERDYASRFLLGRFL
ncbi:hypothetical protein D3Z39_05750 [Anaerotruncus colihominis]|uniref:Uncharacterized protein n=1 Tax=Anaerotruncus colihominis TaxID=169435 RepID=A0A845RFP6_9FIRM|nr:hypothetical protein [Anaerotruncus colihominis]